jgi:hypothetical protein
MWEMWEMWEVGIQRLREGDIGVDHREQCSEAQLYVSWKIRWVCFGSGIALLVELEISRPEEKGEIEERGLIVRT